MSRAEGRLDVTGTGSVPVNRINLDRMLDIRTTMPSRSCLCASSFFFDTVSGALCWTWHITHLECIAIVLSVALRIIDIRRHMRSLQLSTNARMFGAT